MCRQGCIAVGFTLFLVITAVFGTESICKDDSVDCAKMNTLLGICGVKHKAKEICKKYCNLCNMVDGSWSPWSPWAKCNVTCGKGYKLRSRKCDNPAPQDGGLDCEGNSTELTMCDMPVCPVNGGWTLWENWGKCSSTCDVGMRSRTRSCTSPRPQHFGDHCYGNNIEDELCNSESCSVNGGWTLWENWGKCSSTCDVGMRRRTRSCTTPRPQHFGDHCFGNNIEDELCNSKSCSVNGGWTLWENWGKCSSTCDVGMRRRTRSCTNPRPEHFGDHCFGNNIEDELCNSTSCSVNGGWTLWENWGKCSSTCDVGMRSRTRSCTNPRPQHFGDHCFGNNIEDELCNSVSCSVNGGWTLWENWGKCSSTCDVGMRSRTRSCTNPRPQHFGDHCFGNNIEDELCNSVSCSVNGGWALWENWGKCSSTCGVGMRSRTRSCTNPRPQHFGDHCFGNNIEDELCDSKSCLVDGGWTDWSLWGTCSVSCGVGLQSRLRSCTNPSPINEGNQCKGQSMEVNLCYKDLCEGVWSAWQPWSKCVQCGEIQIRERKCLKSFFPECLENSIETKTCDNCYSDCYDIGKETDNPKSGIHKIKLWKSQESIPVYCEFDTDSGGWTVFHYRFNGTIDFNRNFSDYQNGFGSLNGEFWLVWVHVGLDYIYEMVSQGKSELRLDLTSFDGKTAYETFQNFRLDEGPSYTLHIDKGVGTAGDSGSGLSYHNGQKISTYDNDQDNTGGNSAAAYLGGWWYNSCRHVNLNGKYSVYNQYKSFNSDKPLKVTRMMFRRV